MHKEVTDEPELSTAEKRVLAARLLRARSTLARRAPACLHRIFEAHAVLNSEAIALTCDGHHWTYRELNERSNRLARRLRTLGVGPEVLVGIYAERSAEMIVGVLAVLKAGGAYLPLDTAYPADRLAFLIADSQVPILLCPVDLLGQLPDHDATVVDLADHCAGESEDDLLGGAGVESAAYVIYTSGSTGRPKGVVVSHANVSHLMASTQSWYNFGPTDVWTLFHSFAFDFSVWEIWGALTFGGRLIVVPYWVSRSPEAFRDLLHTERVTVLNQTPSAFRQLARVDEASAESEDLALRLVIFGGEALELESLRAWFDRHGDEMPRLVNMYGITETTVHVTYRPVIKEDLDTLAGTSPIGEAIPGWRVALLDRQLQPVPVGVVGEIHVGGKGVARGYLNRPALTAERFVIDPFGGEPGARLYRSGDLARRRPDGSLDYLGRSDHQVKVRGFRIEPGEIESTLLKHAGVCEAVVLAREFGEGDMRLVAYVVGRDGPAPSAFALRDWLKPRLPEYMVPSAFVSLDALPLTQHGKIDRGALPAPDFSGGNYQAPRTPVEDALAEAWGSVLGIDRVGVADNFFDLGGHSLLATQVISRVRDALGIDLPLRTLFESPTISGMAREAEHVLRSGSAASMPALEPRSRTGFAAASFAQQRLWFLDRLDPGRPWYNIATAVHLSGPIHLDALRRAFHALVCRHESLRTIFGEVDGRPVQVIASAPLDCTISVLDLSQDRNAEINALKQARNEAFRPFDLAKGPLFRVSVFKVGLDEHLVLVTTHHAVSDGWSIGILVREVAALYESIRLGNPSPLPPLPVQYADFADRQREWLEAGHLDDQLAAFKNVLMGVPALDLPVDRPRPALPSGRGGERTRLYSKTLAEQLRAIGRAEGATLFMTLLAAFQALLGRYSGQTDFAIGSPVAGRGESKTEGLIGFFVNTMVVRADLAGEPTFRDLVRRVRVATVEAYAYQDLPFEQVVAAVDPRRDPSRTPLFQVMFALQNASLPDVQTAEIRLRPIRLGTVSSKFDLTLAVAETEEGLDATLEFSADLFEAATVDRMLAHFGRFLESAVAEPDLPVIDLPILTDAERIELAQWNETGADLPALCVPQLFENQAAQTPEATALGFEGKSLTYAALNAQADRLARQLRTLGVRPGVLVGLCVERGLEMVVGLLGILKAGGAYLPLDPAFPAARIELMLDQSNVSVLVTQSALKNQFKKVASLVCLDEEPFEFVESEAAEATTDDLAYVIFTSGSTGTPKGVMIPHSALTNFLLSMRREPGFAASDTLLAVTTLSFDIAALEIFLPLISGGRVEIVSREVAADGLRLADAIESSGASVLQATPATWRLLLESGWTGDPDLTILCGGEGMSRDLARRLLSKSKAVWNVYGPTETTVWSTLMRVESGTGSVPIGRPIANTSAYVLDRRRNPVPVGVTGELYLSGAGLARGYLGRPDLTAERFHVDPFASAKDAKMYQTGDLARFRPDGVLECLGRTDGQVKIRGFRVELGDVEAALASHPDVVSAAAKAIDDASGFQKLIGYLVVQNELDITGLRGWLKERLPDYMMPSFYLKIDALPMTPNHKVDRKSLPDPDGIEVMEAGPVIAPRDEVESRLVKVWEDVLQVTAMGVNQSFFDLGGHSLLAIRLLGKIEEEFGRRLPLASLFQGPTIEEQAHVLRAEAPKSSNGPWSPLVGIRREGDKTPFFCVHPAGGIVYCFQDLARQLGGDRPFYALQAAGLEGVQAPFEDFTAMAARYVEAIRTVQTEGPYHLGGWSLGGVIAFEMARQIVDSGDNVGTVALFDSWAPTVLVRSTNDAQKVLAEEVAALGLFDGEDLIGGLDDLAFVLGQFPPEIVEDFDGDALRMIAHLRDLPADARRAFVLRAFQLDLVYHLETGPEQVERLWKVLRANLIAGSKYEPKIYPGRIVLFRAGDAKDAPSTDPRNGWGSLVSGEIHVHEVPGDHTTILRGSNLRVLADKLRAELDGKSAS